MYSGIGRIGFDGEVYRATFRRSTSHGAQRLYGPQGEPTFPDEGAALRAIEARARIDGVTNGATYAGSYPRGTRRPDETIARWMF